jgi:hypothetical protein
MSAGTMDLAMDTPPPGSGRTIHLKIFNLQFEHLIDFVDAQFLKIEDCRLKTAYFAQVQSAPHRQGSLQRHPGRRSRGFGWQPHPQDEPAQEPHAQTVEFLDIGGLLSGFAFSDGMTQGVAGYYSRDIFNLQSAICSSHRQIDHSMRWKNRRLKTEDSAYGQLVFCLLPLCSASQPPLTSPTSILRR